MASATHIRGVHARIFAVFSGEPFPDGSWSVRVQVKSFIRWIWAGALFMALGGFLVVIDPRYSTKLSRAKLS